MKTYTFSKTRTFGAFAIAAISLAVMSPDSYGRDWKPFFGKGRPSSSRDRHDHHDHHDHGRAGPRRSIEMDVQYALAKRGYYRGRIDGNLGSGSHDAIARYQRDHRLAVTGNINLKTLDSLGLR